MAKKKKDKFSLARQLLQKYDLTGMMQEARNLTRRFVLHIGPTNSGKTYQSVEALKQAKNGVYLGPLRLMALEIFDKLNAGDCPCTLLTGEEFELMPGAKVTASTIELCDYGAKYEVAVIDEAQMIGDRSRGANWTKAILMVNAEVVHICMAPEAEDIIVKLLSDIAAPFEIIRHERLTPLSYSGSISSLKQIRDGDALIAFSRRNVLSLAAEMERIGKKVSVIYGALPPAARREEVRKFESKETTVVVATDAIGLGVSLPIKRIIFCATSKYDGEDFRNLRPEEVKQIAGRAGRCGIHKKGEVLAMDEEWVITSGLKSKVSPIKTIYIPFPKETLDSSFDLDVLLHAWDTLPGEKGVDRQDMTEAQFLLDCSDNYFPGASKEMKYQLITCPVDTKSSELVEYWGDCCEAIVAGRTPPTPYFGDESLETCEKQYRAFDIRHQLLRRVGIEEPHLVEKEALIQKINWFLLTEKKSYIRKCSCCGCKLPFNHPYGMCEECYENQHRSQRNWGFDDDDWDDDDEWEDDGDEDF